MIRRLLNKQVDRFEAIHRIATRGVSRDWQTIWLQVEIEGSGTSVARFVANDSNPKPIFVDIPFSEFGRFVVLQRTFDPPWTTMTMIYRRKDDGGMKFEAEAGYEPAPIEFEHERRLAWEAKYFP